MKQYKIGPLLKTKNLLTFEQISVSSGSDGHEMTGYKFFYLPPKTSVEDAMRMINNYVETGEIGF